MPKLPLLTVNNLSAGFDLEDGSHITAIDQLNFTIPRGKTVGIVGESGCGKSVTAHSILQLLPHPHGKITGGSIHFHHPDNPDHPINLTQADTNSLKQIRGNDISMIFQEPMTALDPLKRIGLQLTSPLIQHQKLSKKNALIEAISLLKQVGIPSPEQRLNSYPHELSGGMRQRILIAMAIACKPHLLIADEPTTALDVTIQAQILQLLLKLQEDQGLSLLLITHNLGVIAQTCDEVIVMYAGRIVEHASAEALFNNPLHPYTQELLKSIPSLDHPPKEPLHTIPGQAPPIQELGTGCRFANRHPKQPPHPDNKRPIYKEIQANHWIEYCPHCQANPL